MVRYEEGRLQCEPLSLSYSFVAHINFDPSAVLCAPSKLLTRHDLLNFKKAKEFKISLLSASPQHLHLSDAPRETTKAQHQDKAIAHEVFRIVAGWKSEVKLNRSYFSLRFYCDANSHFTIF